MANRRVAHASIKVYSSALAYFFRLLGFPFALDTFPRLQFLLRGIRRAQGNSLSRPSRAPISVSHLLTLHPVIFARFTPHDALMVWAACLTAFYGLLRVSEFTAHSPVSFSPSTLLFRHVSFLPSPPRFRLFLPMSKTDQFATGAAIFLFVHPQPLCPVTALSAFLGVRPSRPGPLFTFANGSYLTRDVVLALLRVAFPSQPSLNTHSFRVGGARFCSRSIRGF